MTKVWPRTILLPLDGSHLAEAVLPIAAAIAGNAAAELLVLHVLERNPPAQVHGQRHLTRLDQAEAYLAEIAASLRAQGARVRTHVHEEPVTGVAASLARHAHEADADLILITTHGSGGMRRALLGSIAQQALRQSTRNVLLVRPDAPWRGPEPERPWVAAIDAAGHQPRDLDAVASLAAACGARLHLLTVVPTLATVPGERRTAALLTPTATSAVLDLQEREAGVALERFRQNLADAQHTTTEVRRGDPAGEILAALAEHDAGLLALFTHGRAGIAGALAGSMAATLTGRTKLPVLLIPAQASTDASQ